MLRSLLTYLSESCQKYPDKSALRYKSENLSYRDLDHNSSQLACLLRDSGIMSGERVGIYLDKSPEAIVAIFGVLKTGSCYVPLDPIAPTQRLTAIVNDCRLKWLITSESKLAVTLTLAAHIKSLKRVVVLDADRPDANVEPTGIAVFFRDDLHHVKISEFGTPQQSNQRDLAYILYTSGSTGLPKGVMISHGAACAFVDWAQKKFQIESTDVLSAHAPLHFDLSIFDIFVAVASGATICLIPTGWSTFPRTIADFIVKNGITTWYSVPTALIQLLIHGGLEERHFPDLKRILFAGEVFPSKYLAQLMDLLPDVDFFNLYGPTETNVITCHHVQEPPSADEDVPIGALCEGVAGFVVSEAGTLASRAETGELYVKGPSVMDGYWGDDQKTSEVFTENPFDPQDKSLVYKTGDLVHRDEKGVLIYHGRRDTMVKSRGYRIELGEIETVLTAHAKIKESVAVAQPSEHFGTTIKAILVAQPEASLGEEEVRRFCREKLPIYMVPETICFTGALPRTSTGKIDRKALLEDSF